VKPKTLMLIAGVLAAEQRTIVAHSASYGKPCSQIFQAPAGAKENYSTTAQIVRRTIRRSIILAHYSHSASYGSDRPHISQAPVGATENHRATPHFFRLFRGLNRFTAPSHGCHRGLLSYAAPWLKQNPLRT